MAAKSKIAAGAKSAAIFLIALPVAWFLYVLPLGLLLTIAIAAGQWILGAAPTPFDSHTSSDWFFAFEVVLTFIIAAALLRCRRRHSWRAMLGLGCCLNAVSLAVLLPLLLGGWHADVDFVNALLLSEGETLEDALLALPLHISFGAALGLVFWGGIGALLLKMWRILAASAAVAGIALSAAAWAGIGNATGYCLANGYWEGSPVHEKIIGYLESSDDPDRIYPGIIYVSHLYLSGPLMLEGKCYTSDDRARYSLLKKHLFRYPDFPETSPRLQDLIARRAAEGDVPAMLLFAHMHAQGQGVEKDAAQAEMWWGRALSSSAEDWMAEEEAFVLGGQQEG